MLRTFITRAASASSRRPMAASAVTGILARNKHTLPDLPYDFHELEPVISAEIMRLHYTKHHQTYVNNLNVAEEQLAGAVREKDPAEYISLASALKFNGGGHINHSIFWTNLAPPKKGGGEAPTGDLLEAIKRDFGSLEAFITKFNASTAAVQGSGWGWLGYHTGNKTLQIATTSNQDPLKPTTGLVPLLGVDVWEHAYYLDYKNARPDYLNVFGKWSTGRMFLNATVRP
ncbi:mitochondrial manganese superoxide dismutase [Syncephalis fuscata]|nr:mitochondrial manganese superoxide dismutase [Syncephalis fuscata]